MFNQNNIIMPQSKYGVDAIKKVIGWILGIASDIPKAMADGKLTLKDFPLFMDDAFKLPGVVTALPDIQKEYLDMDPAERAGIDSFVRESIDNPDADVQEVIALAFKTVIDASGVASDVMELIAAIKKLKD